MIDDTTDINDKKSNITETVFEEANVSEAEIIREEKSLGERLCSGKYWLRAVFMVLFCFIGYVAAHLIFFVIVLQFVWALVNGESNERVRDFSSSLAQYLYQTLRFLTFNVDDKPFPFADWPDNESGSKED